jgi:hypothetical protein
MDLAALPSRDEKLRRLASEIAGQLPAFFQNPRFVDSFIDAVEASGTAAVVIPVSQTRQGKREAREAGLPATDLRFRLVFDQHTPGGMASYRYDPDDEVEHTIRLNMLPHDIRGEFENPRELLVYVVGALLSNQHVVVHELTHMLDSMRGGHYGKVRPPLPEDSEDRAAYMRMYVNNPVEYNTHFQQAMFELENYLDIIDWEDPQDVGAVLSTYAEFEKRALRTEALGQFMHYANPQYKQRVRQRLYQTWQHLRDTR